MLIIVVSRLLVIFVGFSVIVSRNATAILAWIFSALAVSSGIFLILELDEPFGGDFQRANGDRLAPDWEDNGNQARLETQGKRGVARYIALKSY